MGQYYKPLILTEGKRTETFYSWDFESGLKLMEHSWLRNDFVNAVMLKIVNSPKRIAWLGDYSDYDEVIEKLVNENDFIPDKVTFMKYYKRLWGNKAIKSQSKERIAKMQADIDKLIENIKSYYLINHTKKEYINLGEYYKLYQRNEWCTHPLSILTACGNGLGGGDYYEKNENSEMVGYWAFDMIEASTTKPTDKEYADVTDELGFVED